MTPEELMICNKCKLLSELYGRTPQGPHDYWIMTELFTMLHNGKDYCNEDTSTKPYGRESPEIPSGPACAV